MLWCYKWSHLCFYLLHVSFHIISLLSVITWYCYYLLPYLSQDYLYNFQLSFLFWLTLWWGGSVYNYYKHIRAMLSWSCLVVYSINNVGVLLGESLKHYKTYNCITVHVQMLCSIELNVVPFMIQLILILYALYWISSPILIVYVLFWWNHSLIVISIALKCYLYWLWAVV